MTRLLRCEQLTIYRIRVKGTLDPSWSEWFEGMTIETTAGGDTMLTGPVRDQAALHGLLVKIRDMGLPLIALEQVKRADAAAAENG